MKKMIYPERKYQYVIGVILMFFYVLLVGWLIYDSVYEPFEGSSHFIIQLIYCWFGQIGLIVFNVLLGCVILLMLGTKIQALYLCFKRFRELPSDWKQRLKKLERIREKMLHPKESVNKETLVHFMCKTNLPQQQIEIILSGCGHKIVPEGIVVFPEIEFFVKNPVYFEPDNYYLYKTGSSIIIAVKSGEKLFSYRVDESMVDFVYKCENLANDIRNSPLAYEGSKI